MKSRVLTALGLIPFVLGAFFCASPWPLLSLATIVGAIGVWELSSLLENWAAWLGFFWLFALVPMHAGLDPLRQQHWFPILYFLIGIVATADYARRRLKLHIQAALAALWILVPLLCLVSLHANAVSETWQFRTPMLLAVLPLWGGDTAAIFAGKAFGKHLLAPGISPKKTVEGSIANLVVCVIVAACCGLFIDVPMWAALSSGIVAGTLGQVGDLFESYLKRQVDVKDSGSLLPGHGGMLDRIDSVLFTAPFVWLILSFVKYP
ncbi:MAG: phosphatidate cytidylyltransferase [Fimbriimonas sp.]|nr:phosphatidate cytidylyltransferase [Fimbriimonas sp.]